MVKIYTSDLLLRNGSAEERNEYEGTNSERLSYSTSNLKDCDIWFETDTFKLYFWNASSSEWVTKE